MALQAAQPQSFAEQVDPTAITRPSKGIIDEKTLTTLAELSAVQARIDKELEGEINPSNALIFNVSMSSIQGGGAILERMAELYALGFQRSGWGEVNSVTDGINLLQTQFKDKTDDDLSITILKYRNKVHGFLTSQMLQREVALGRVATSIIGYRQGTLKPEDYVKLNPQEYMAFFQQLKANLEQLLSNENSYNKRWNFQENISVMEDIVIGRRVSSLQNISSIIHHNASEMLAKHEKAGDNNPYALTWTNKSNPIYKFLMALGYPHVKLAEMTRTVTAKNKAGVMETKDITLVVFAINLKDLCDITESPEKAKLILASRGFKNDPWGTVKALGGSIMKSASRLQTKLTSSNVMYGERLSNQEQ